ncbi:MAG: aminotransferase class V-fold PLP-dependent enzyme [Bdellovibrionota bacterium]
MKLGQEIRAHFPVFKAASVDGLEPAFLDSAASAQKPQQVIDSFLNTYQGRYANIHRGAYALSINATAAYEAARKKVAAFIGAKDPDELVFVRGTTEGINLVAYTLGSTFSPGDSILLTEIEHHSNIVPWQIIAEKYDLKLHFVKIKEDASIDLADYREKLAATLPKLVAFSYISNAFGTRLPIGQMIDEAKSAGALVLIDGAQAVPHKKINVAELGVDFFTFSGHKMYGPTGIGGLWAPRAMLESLPPFHGGVI